MPYDASVIAFAVVNADGSTQVNRGCRVVRQGVGDYAVFLSTPVADEEFFPDLQALDTDTLVQMGDPTLNTATGKRVATWNYTTKARSDARFTLTFKRNWRVGS